MSGRREILRELVTIGGNFHRGERRGFTEENSGGRHEEKLF